MSRHAQRDGATDAIQRLSEHFADAPSTFTTSPLYRELCPTVASERSILELLVDCRAGQQPSFLLFGAVHYVLLSGADHPLRDFYPSLAGAAAADPSGAGPFLKSFCSEYRDELLRIVRTRLVQTNVVKRVFGLRFALNAIRARSDEPVHLVEVGASAGIHLLCDRYRYEIGGRAFGPRDASVTVETEWRGATEPPDLDDVPAIASRIGVDLDPVDVTVDDERLWLRALVWPEDRRKAELLEAALDVVASDPPTMVEGDAIDVCPALGRTLPPGPRVVFHAATRMHVAPERRAAFDDAIDAIGDGGPLYHVWQEPQWAPHRGAAADARGAIEMHGPGDDAPVALVRVDGHLEWMAPL